MFGVRALDIYIKERKNKMINIIYWSGTGNTESMAQLLAQGVTEAGGEANLVTVAEATVDMVKDAEVVALGCPSMGAEVLEEEEMEPFMCELDSVIAGKKIALFGSYGWGNQEWMRDWEERIANDGATVVDGMGITVLGEPDEETAAALKNLGKMLVTN